MTAGVLVERREVFGPLERLRAVMRRRVPVVAVALVGASEGGAPSRAEVLRVTYRQCGPWEIVWDGNAGVDLPELVGGSDTCKGVRSHGTTEEVLHRAA